jgi:hypothetical protein
MTACRLILWITLLTTLALLPALSAPAEAGCLREWQQCGDCAERAFWAAVRRLDPGDAADAWVDALDCDIDLYHCISMAHHHEYICAV